MKDDSLAYVPALEQARRVRAGELSPIELVQLYIDRIDRIDPSVGSMITVAAEFALAAAKEAEAALVPRRRSELPTFHGIPVVLKDVVDTAGIRTTYGSGAWHDRVPDTDHAVVTKLKTAGFIILGKTKTPEFSGGVITEPLAFGPCRNPWDLDRSCGGSSGGSGAAIAARLSSIALGGDDGGSIRIPSNWNGIFGIKPSRGRVSCAPDPAAMQFTDGPMALSVADGAAMLDAISGYVTGDGFWAAPPARPFLEEVGADPGRLRIALTVCAADGIDVDADAVAATYRAGALLEQLGHHVEEVSDWPGRGTFPDNRAVALQYIYGAKFDGLARWGVMPAPEDLEPGQQLLVEMSRQATAADVMLANHLAAETSRRIVEFFDGFDAMVTPVMACRPPVVGRFVDHPEEALALLSAVQWTAQFSETGQPAVAVPIGLDSCGTPVGVQLAGRPADEATLLRVAAQLEEANPWIQRVPPGC